MYLFQQMVCVFVCVCIKKFLHYHHQMRSRVMSMQVCHQKLSSAFDFLLIFLCSLIQTLTLTPPPNNANMDK